MRGPSARAFSGSYRATLRSEEFRGFHSELKTLEETLAGKASFKTLEGQLTLSLEGDEGGRWH